MLPSYGQDHEAATSATSSIGAMLIESGRLTNEAAESVLRYQRQNGPIRFGDAAVKLGLITQAEVDYVVARQFDYPYLIPGQSQVDPLVVAAYQPFDPRVEALRAVRTQLLLRLHEAGQRRYRVALVSAEARDGRSVLAANLAVVFSQLGEKTLLIDADMRAPKQDVLFGIDNSAGLSTILSGRAGLETIRRIPALVDLSVLPSGAIPPNPQELLNRDAFGELLDKVASRYDVVLLDTSPAPVHADALTIANRAGNALVVARQNYTPLAGVRSLVRWMTQAHVAVLGSVLNAF